MTQNSRRLLDVLVALVLLVAEFGCTRIRIDMVRVTQERYPAKGSIEAVQALTQAPTQPYQELADFVARGRSATFHSLREKILEQAAAIGADAVIFARPEEHVKEGITYQPMYSPWGYSDPYYGPDPWGYGWSGRPPGYGYPYGGYMAVPYEIVITSLRGTAIRYTTRVP